MGYVDKANLHPALQTRGATEWLQSLMSQAVKRLQHPPLHSAIFQYIPFICKNAWQESSRLCSEVLKHKQVGTYTVLACQLPL